MSALTIGINAAVSLLIIASLALTMMRQVRHVHSGAQWPIRDGTRVLATITDVQIKIKQDWKERERWERHPWDGSLVRQRTWQTYYDVTAQWVHSQTKQRYTFRSKVWSDDAANGAFDTIAESSSCLHLAWDSKIAGTRQFSLEGQLDVTTINAWRKAMTTERKFMETRFYASEKLDIERFANDLGNTCQLQGYQVQQPGNREQKLVQLPKGSDVEALLATYSQANLRQRLAPKFDHFPTRVPYSTKLSAEDTAARWQILQDSERSREVLMDAKSLDHISCFQGNIENFIGTVKVPVGLAGPLRVNGLFAQGDYYIPLATTEATLVASYNRGAQLISEAGGCSAMLLDERVGRAPGFAFRTLEECGLFVTWVLSQWEALQREADSTTRYGKLVDTRVAIEGNHVYLHFDFETADAAGQNMVTIATEAICAYITQHCPVVPRYFFVEANFSGDKKASAQSLLTVRGKKVSAEVIIPAELVHQRLHTTPERMADFCRMGSMGAVLSGTIGAQGHFANGLAALYIACGQDAACVAESAVGVTRFEVTAEGHLYATVTLPNLIVGTVGGGTGLPSQHACLDILKLAGPGKAQALAEVCAAVCLAGEISLVAALCAGHFTRAHKRLARDRMAPQEEAHHG